MNTSIPETTRGETDPRFLPEDIRQLLEKVAELPEEQQKMLQNALQGVVRGTQRRHELLQLVQEAVAQVRLDMKYLVFDLEATRKERDAYRPS
ncbi:MAG: transcriptional regulator [Planctomycetia bacterium]|nr:transcriptional regulator [Planctomycetia bacterium]